MDHLLVKIKIQFQKLGENRLGEEYYEFYVDEDALLELRLKLFYFPKG